MVSDRCLSCLSVTLVDCGQTAGWIKMPLGREIGLGPWGHSVRWGHSSPHPTFRPMSIVTNNMPLGMEIVSPIDTVINGDPAPPPQKKGALHPPLFAHIHCDQTVAHLSNC